MSDAVVTPVVEVAVPAAAPVAEVPVVAPATETPPAAPAVSRAAGFVQNLLNERKKAQDGKRAEVAKAQESAQFAKIKAEAEKLQYIRENAHKDPSLLIKEFNVPTDSLIRANLGTLTKPEPTEDELFDQKMEKYLAPFREKAAKYDEFIGQSEANQRAQANVQEKMLMDNIKSVSKSENHEWLEHYGQEAYDVVRETMYAYWEANEIPLSYSDACARVNEYYEERAIALSKTNAFQKISNKTVPQETKAVKETVPAAPAKSSVSERVAKSEPNLTMSPSQILASSDAAWQELKKRKFNKK